MNANCPLGKQCRTESEQCAWLIQLKGTHPQTGQEIDEEGCAIAWIPILLVDIGRHTNAQVAAVEDFRNKVHKGLVELAGMARAKPLS